MQNKKALAAVSSLCALMCASTAWAAGYTVTDLGIGSATGINNKGQVIGTAGVYGTPPVLWDSDGTKHTLTGLTDVVRINEQGDVVGGVTTSGSDPRYPQKKVVLTNVSNSITTISGISTLADYASAVIGLDDTGRVMVNSNAYTPVLWRAAPTPVHTANDTVYALQLTGLTADGFTVIGSGAKKASNALGYTVVNFMAKTATGGNDAGLITITKTFTFSPTAISSGHLIVGKKNVLDTKGVQTGVKGYVWSQWTGEVALPNLPNTNETHPIRINAKAQVIGNAFSTQSSTGYQFYPYFWSPTTGAKNLNALIGTASSSIKLIGASGINDAGQIAATGTINSETHAFVLTPAP